MAKKPNKAIHCPVCNSANVLYRIKTDDFWCRKCGHQWKREKT